MNASFLSIKPLCSCTLPGENILKALINKCFIVILQTLLIVFPEQVKHTPPRLRGVHTTGEGTKFSCFPPIYRGD
jgi:hypothetical protein